MAAWDQCGYTGSRAQEDPALLFFIPVLKVLLTLNKNLAFLFCPGPCTSRSSRWSSYPEHSPATRSSAGRLSLRLGAGSGGRVWAPDSDPARANVSAKMNAQSDKPPASVLEKVMPFL